MYRLVKNNGECEIFVYEYIDNGGVTAEEIVSFLSYFRGELKNITIRINSRGGDLGEALGIYHYLKSLNVPKTAYIDGVAMSAATIIAMAGDKVIMPEDALMMIHNPWTYCEGDADEMRAVADSLTQWRDICVSIYMKKTGLSREEIIDMMNKQTQMAGRAAKEKGFVDEIDGEVQDELRNSYEAGVRAERKRLQELDDLMTSDRREAIIQAKYETFKRASDIAVELLKKEKPLAKRNEEMRLDADEISGVSAEVPPRDEIESGVKKLNRMRGYAE